MPGSRSFSYTIKAMMSKLPINKLQMTAADFQAKVEPPQAVPRMIRPTPKRNKRMPPRSKVEKPEVKAWTRVWPGAGLESETEPGFNSLRRKEMHNMETTPMPAHRTKAYRQFESTI
jgi:hypothetical protein